MYRRIIVSNKEPPKIHKCDGPTIWVQVLGKGYGAQVFAYSREPFNYGVKKKAKRVDKNPPVYQVSNTKNKTGEVVRDGWHLIDELAARNNAEVDWSRIVLYHLRKQNLEERAKAA